MNPTPMWKFRQKTRAEIHANPVHAEFFAPKGIAEQFVREGVQNSLDATMPSANTTRVVISFLRGSEARTTPDTYLAKLRPHLERVEEFEGQLPPADERISALIFEDFGTSGLEGDPADVPESNDEKADKNRFYFFFKNIGRSGKSDESRGRWGLGKTVFPSSSKINSFFGLTIRASDGRRLLMGQAQLKEHSLPGSRVRFDPYGFFANHEGENGDYIQLPLEDKEFLDRFSADFGLKRKTEPGLSVVVPYPRGELTFDDVLRAGILHYFYPILAGKLVIEIIEGGRMSRLDNATIQSTANALKWDADHQFLADLLPGRLEHAAWVVRSKELPVSLREPPLKKAPCLDNSLFHPKQHEELANRFAGGERLAIRVPVFVEKKGSEPLKSFFDVFLQYDPALRRGDDQYLRSGITISQVAGQAPAGVRALLIVDDAPLAALLGDSEGPSHETWHSRGVDRISNRYVRGPTTIQFVKTAVKRLSELLLTPVSVRDTKLLQDIFFVDEPTVPSDDEEDKANEGAPGGPAGAKKPPPPTLPPGPAKPFITKPRDNGFIVKGNSHYTGPRRPVRIGFAYAVFRGNPMKQFRDADFSLHRRDDLRVSLAGVKETLDEAVKAPNILEVTPTTSDFVVEVTGFDRNRGLRVDARSCEIQPEDEA
jgi:hypothetical protein